MKKYLIIVLFSLSAYTQDYDFRHNQRVNRTALSDSLILINDNNSRDEEELIEFIENIMQTHLIPGLSVSIVKNNAVVWDRHFGFANIDENLLVDENTMFILSSVSKTITATALMQLWEQNLFQLDDDINDYLPFEVIHPDYPNFPITFKMLLTHTSGIKDNWSVMTYYEGDSTLELSYYLEQYLVPSGEFYGSNSSFTNYQPGTNYIYTNNGAALIGLLVEEISSQPFNEYCNNNIFEPLSMDNAFWFLSEIDNLTQIASPYQLTGGNGDSCYEIGCGVYNQSNPCFCDSECVYYNDCCSDYDDVCGENGSGSSDVNLTEYEHYGYSDYPSGQLRTSSNNLANFMLAYMNDGFYNNVNLLESETIDLIKTIQYPDINSMQGLIWYYKNESGRTLFGHNGGDLGSLTEMFISLDEEIGVVVLSNSSNYNAVAQIENAVFNFAQNTEFVQTGDINSDDLINILDIILVVNIILGNSNFNSLADINNDEVIDILDIVQLVNIILS